MRDVGLAKEDVLLALAAMCQIERVPFDASLVLREFPPPYSLETLLHAAGRLGFEAATRQAAADGIAAIGTPCVVVLAGVPVEGAEVPAHRLAVVTRATETELQLIEPGRAGPATVTPEGFAARFTGLVVQFALAGKPVADPDARAEAAPVFGFRWFVPELLKHKPIWRDVLLASLAIQLIALATPLFTQVVIDKVIVHQTLNTLTVIGVALGVFIVFSAAMSWVRQYLVLHTGNRVDAVLGTRVFEHLVGLPAPLFRAPADRRARRAAARRRDDPRVRERRGGDAAPRPAVPRVFLAIMFYYSWLLTLITLAVLAAIVAMSIAIVPLIRGRLNEQFLLGARNQAFLTEYVAGDGDGEVAADGAAAAQPLRRLSSRAISTRASARASSPIPTTSPRTRSSSS